MSLNSLCMNFTEEETSRFLWQKKVSYRDKKPKRLPTAELYYECYDSIASCSIFKPSQKFPNGNASSIITR